MNPLSLPPEIELQAGGPRFWRSLEEWSRSPAFLPWLHREFPEHAGEWPGDEAVADGVGRRRFLQLMGASLALAGLGGCRRQAQEYIVPYVKRPEEIIPGRPVYYATTFPHRGYGTGLVVRTEMARPIKIEGNPDHPASLGASDVFMQASVLGLYDPDRSQFVRHGRDIATLDDVTAFALARAGVHDRDRGAGLFLLTGRITSPSVGDQLARLHARFPKMSWCAYEPAEPAWSPPAAPDLANPEPVFDLARAQVIVSLGADFLRDGPARLALTKAFTARRRDPTAAMNRLYVVESAPSITGAKADVRWARKPSEIVDFARQLASSLGAGDAGVIEGTLPADVAQLVRDLQDKRGQSVVIAGPEQPREVRDLAAAINQTLGNVGATVRHRQTPGPALPATPPADFVKALHDGAAHTLVVAGVNPIYDLPPGLDFSAALARVPHALQLGLYDDETGSRCAWHVPESHYLESWGDLLAFDGTPSLVQPMIERLYPDTLALPELLSLFLDTPPRGGYDIVHDFWQTRLAAVPNAWKRALNKGVITGLPVAAEGRPPASTAANTHLAKKAVNAPRGALELVILPDPAVDDGRYANNGWLQELPRPLNKLTWDNVAMLSPATAKDLALETGGIVAISANGATVEAPVWIQPGHADGCVSVTLGYGRKNIGAVANDVGFNAYRLRAVEADAISHATLRPVGRMQPLASTQNHFSMEGRGLVQVQTLADFRADPHRARENEPNPDPRDDLYAPFPYDGHAWAMSIDLGSCTGCNACIVACQAENNSPVVGREQVLRGREMHWIRVDRYFEGAPENPAMHFQPVVCMQCEQAPCEVVCPVGATVHGSEGLNDMVYNRCVGTRYCSNNCPYKVRRFNFLMYDDETHPTIALQKNPDVTVRTRGVMEKCTYCVQRIEAVRIEAEKAMRPIRDGEIVTACQQACPAAAIVFGDKNDPQSRVAKLKAQPRDYGLLAELNTRPRTTYLAKITNPPAAT